MLASSRIARRFFPASSTPIPLSSVALLQKNHTIDIATTEVDDRRSGSLLSCQVEERGKLGGGLNGVSRRRFQNVWGRGS